MEVFVFDFWREVGLFDLVEKRRSAVDDLPDHFKQLD
jgi:hypothetical protein